MALEQRDFMVSLKYPSCAEPGDAATYDCNSLRHRVMLTIAERLGVSERTIEKMVRAKKFPPPLKIGKSAMWADEVVNRWLDQALAPQLTWEAPRRTRASSRAL